MRRISRWIWLSGIVAALTGATVAYGEESDPFQAFPKQSVGGLGETVTGQTECLCKSDSFAKRLAGDGSGVDESGKLNPIADEAL